MSYVQKMNHLLTAAASSARLTMLQPWLVTIGLVTTALLSACSVDNPSSGITVNAESKLITSEDHTVATFTIVLNKMPQSDVSITARVSDTSEGRLSLNQDIYSTSVTLLFTPNDWHVPQTVYVRGFNDNINDGDTDYTVIIEPAISSDPSYDGIDPRDVSVTNVEGTNTPPVIPGEVVISPTTELVTSETGSSASFQISLSREPTHNVSIIPKVQDSSEGEISPVLVVIEPPNWQTGSQITVTGLDDTITDGDQRYNITFTTASSDPAFNNLTVTPVGVVNQDDESVTLPTAGVTVTPTGGLVTSENGLTASFSVVLKSRPATGTQVTISANVSDTTLASIDPASVTFNDSATDWSTAKTFTLTGLDDTPPVLGDKPYSVTLSAGGTDSAYVGIAINSVQAINQDNDGAASPGITVSPTTGLQTTELGATATFTVRLNTSPAAGETVTISAGSNDASEGTLAPTSIPFTVNNWQTPQQFTITGIDDSLADGDQNYAIDFVVNSSLGASSSYQGFALDPVNATNIDNETASVSLSIPATGIVTSEDLTSATFTVVLDVEPAADVTISATSTNPAEGTVSPASLTFSPTGGTNPWDQAQTFTVTGVDDTILDGDQQYNINLVSTSTDQASPYHGLNIPAVQATNLDNEVAVVPGVQVTPTQGLVTSESGTTATFDVVLNTQPGADVTLTLASSNTTEGVVAPTSLTFTTTDWSVAQTVTVTGQDDIVVDGPISYTVNLTATSTDTAYDSNSGLTINPVNIVNEDNDTSSDLNVGLYIEPATIDVTASPDSNVGAKTLNLLGYQTTAAAGQVPGPVIEALADQMINITLVNESFFDHLFEIPPVLSAATPLTGGSTIIHRISFPTSGIYRYGSAELGGRGLGYYGALVVKPADGSLTAWSGGPSYDKERNWVLSDLDLVWTDNVITGGPAAVNTTQYNPTYFFINGKNGHAAMSDLNTKIDGVVGDRFLIRIFNAGQYDQSLHFHGNHFAVLSENGVNNTALTDATIGAAPTLSTINVKRNSSAMILYTLKALGSYPVHVHTANMMTGNGVYLNGTATSITVQ